MTERWLDQFLGAPIGSATRDQVTDALRNWVLGTIVAEEENPDGTTASHVTGTLVEASRDPATWDHAEIFSVVTSEAAGFWHMRPEMLASYPDQAAAVSAEPLLTFGVPEAGITGHPGTEPGTSGYRFTREDGSALAVILWADVMHVTHGGDIAPGIGEFTTSIGDAPGSPRPAA